MDTTVKALLAARGIHPADGETEALAGRWHRLHRTAPGPEAPCGDPTPPILVFRPGRQP